MVNESVLFWNCIRLILAGVVSFWICFGYDGWHDHESSSPHFERRLLLGSLSGIALVAVARVIRRGPPWQKVLGVICAVLPAFGLFRAVYEIQQRLHQYY